LNTVHSFVYLNTTCSGRYIRPASGRKRSYVNGKVCHGKETTETCCSKANKLTTVLKCCICAELNRY